MSSKLAGANCTVRGITLSTQNYAQAGSQGPRPLPRMNLRLNVSERLIWALGVCHGVCLLLQDLLQSCSRGGEEESGRHVL